MSEQPLRDYHDAAKQSYGTTTGRGAQRHLGECSRAPAMLEAAQAWAVTHAQSTPRTFALVAANSASVRMPRSCKSAS